MVVTMITAAIMASSCLGRLSLASYLQHLDSIRASSDQAFVQVKKTLEAVRTGASTTDSINRGAAQAERVLKSCLAELAKLQTPDDAAKLHQVGVGLYS